MHLHEIQQHLIEAFNSGTITEAQFLRHAGAVQDLDELMQVLPSTDKREVYRLFPTKPVVAHEQ